MQSAPRQRTILLPRRALLLFIVFLLVAFLTQPALAKYLGPDRTTTELVTVRDPDKDVWTLIHVDPSDNLSDVCLIIHTCDQHPSVERQQALCGWVADNAVSCVRAYKTEEQTVTLPEATIAGALQDCNLNNGWCTTPPTLHLTANEPLVDESILLIEGTRNNLTFTCEDEEVACDIELLEGGNEFEFWALSSHGDSSQKGVLSAQVDTVTPVSAFSNPPEGSVVWVKGTLNLAGSSADETSGVVDAEMSLNGGSGWSPLALGSGGNWAFTWDTSSVPDGTYLVLVRASDLAGHLETTARITVHVDSSPPTVEIPDSRFIWEPLAIEFDDSGVGVETVELTIDGGAFGLREYSWTAANVPDDFIWDRHVGAVIAPIGEYPVTVQAWDVLGNSTSATGLILIPAPEEPETSEDVSEPLTAPASTEAPEPAATPIASGLSTEPTATNEPVAAALVEEAASSIDLAEPAMTTTSTEGGSGGLLWGAAALAAAASATAYALNRRKARQEQIEKMRREAAEAASPGAFARRLSSLRARAEAVVAPIRNSMIIAAAVTQATLELARQRAEEARRQRAERLRAEREERAEQGERRAALPVASTPAVESTQPDAWQRIELQRAQEYAGYSSPPRPNVLADPLGFISHYSDLARDALRGYAIFNLVQAAREISITEVTTTLRVRGPLSARGTLGFRERVNWLRPENIERLAQSPALRAIRSLRSWGVVFGLGGNLANDTAGFLEGDYDRHEYASALTIDSGITIAAALIGGAIAGFVTGALIGTPLGTVAIPIPIVGTITGAAVAGVFGGIAGILIAGAAVNGLQASGIRDFLVDKVGTMYRGWTETTP